tara:strand:- start:956 stop:2446 length:1491 start_codon:yes stop_codon:yes gene_type:complete
MKLKKFIKTIFINLIFIQTIYVPQMKTDQSVEGFRNIVEKKSYKNNETISIELNNLKKILTDNNNELKKYKSQIVQSEAILKSKFVAWSPRINLQSNEMPKLVTGNDFNKFSANTASNKLSVGFDTTIEWDLINPKRKLEIKIAKDQLNNNKLFYKAYLEDLFLESLKIFYLIQASYKEIDVAKESIEISELAFNEADSKLKSGIGNKLDLLEAKIQLDRDQINLINQIGKLKKNINSLSKILNISEEIKVKKEDFTIIKWVWENDQEESLLSAFKNRSELKIKNKDIDINTNKALSILSNKKPDLTLYNKYSISTARGESGVTGVPNLDNLTKSNLNTVGLKFSWNIFDGGLIRQNYLSLKEKNSELEAEFQLSKAQIKQELMDSLINLDTSQKNIILSFDQLKAARETLKISIKRMEAGLTTQREIVNIQGDVSESEKNFIKAITDYNLSLSQLERITLLDKSDFCKVNNQNIKSKNNYFYKFINENKLNSFCS